MAMDPDAVRRAYDAVAQDYAERLPDTRAEAALDLAMVDEFGRMLCGRPVLDAGCGAGRLSRYLADRGCTVDGVDLSPRMVAQARAAHPDLAFAVGSLEALPHPDDTFAGVLLWYSIIHTPPERQPRIFAEVVRVLRPGGHVLVGFQSGTGVRDVSAAYSRFGHDVTLERYLFTADQVSTGLAAAGVQESARMVRSAQASESEGQAVLLAQLAPPG